MLWIYGIIKINLKSIKNKEIRRGCELNNLLFNQFTTKMPLGYALHKFVIDENGQPSNYVFIDVNLAFESHTGLKANDIIGKKVTEVHPEIINDPFNWINVYSKVAFEGLQIQFEQYFHPAKRWYKIYAYQADKGYFITLFEDVTDKKHLESQNLILETELKRQEIIIEIYRDQFTNEQEFLDNVLHRALEISKSQYGYIYLYDENTCELKLNSWTNGVMPDCKIIDKQTVYQLEKTGIWGEVVRQRKPIIVNDFNAPNKLKKGYPKQHVKLRNYMSIPVFDNEKIIAVVGVANNDTGYSDFDANQLIVLIQSAWGIKKQKELENEVKRFKVISDNASHGNAISDLSGHITYVNKFFANIHGYSPEELIGKNISILHTQKQLKAVDHVIERLLQVNHFDLQEIWHKHKNGTEFPMLMSGVMLKDETGKPEFIATSALDITKQKQIEEELRYLAYHDYLTGTHNRRYIEETFERLNENEYYPLAFIMADINGLKIINDTYGHICGDELIVRAVEIMDKIINDKGVLSRIGGDEFGILFKNANEDDIAKITEELEKTSNLYIETKYNDKVFLSVSFGYALQKDCQKNLDYLYKESEKNLYKAKFLNKDSVHYHMIQAMMSTLFQKSKREQHHSIRVGDYAEDIASALNWSKNNINRVKLAGILHDIGKIIINEGILNKEATLEESEWDLMKQHSAKGSAIIEEIDEYEDLKDIIKFHHERWDGKGYPSGLQGEEIPVEARIIAIADSYDAMTEDRPYRKKISKEEAIKELRRCSGSQFDPNIIDVFIKQVLTNN